MGGSLKEFIINTEAGLVLIAAMIVATAFFVAAEFSLVASNRKKLKKKYQMVYVHQELFLS